MTSDSEFPGNSRGEDSPSPPVNWVSHRGPANWFQFRCPADLCVRQNETFIEISRRPTRSSSGVPGSDDGSSALSELSQASLVIHATWVEDRASGTQATFDDIQSLFPEITISSPEAPLELSIASRSWSGISRRPVNGAWWQRWLTRRSTYQWRCWAVLHPSIQIRATIQSLPGRPLDPEFTAVCEQILNTLEMTDSPAWPPEVFRRNVIRLATEHYPLLRITSVGAFGIRIDDSEINLANFYRSYLQQPEKFKRIVLPGITTVVRLQELGPDQIMPGLDEARDRIFPMLSPESETPTEDTIRVPWVGGLCVSFVLDEDESYRFVHRRMLQDWNLSTEDLHELAIRNLRAYAVDNPLEVTMVGDTDDPRLLMPVRPNAYNCARLLDPGFHGRLRELFGPELIVGIPNRDFFVAVSLKHPLLIRQVRQKVADDYSSMHHPLTRRLLVISADGVSEYCQEPV